MKKLTLIFTVLILVCTSCGSGQKPSSRDDVWGGNIDNSIVKEITLSGEQVLVPFKRTNSGLAEIQISLNGVPFNMWWDTGASITCISKLELQKLVKEGKISSEDFNGTITAGLADGSTTEEAVFIIKEIYIQGQDNKYLILKDVAATISANAQAPLLIGQNIISNLPKHTFDESAGIIVFEK